jgi:hypothetical protein
MSNEINRLRGSWESSRQQGEKRKSGYDLVLHPFEKKLFGRNMHPDNLFVEINEHGFRSDNFKKDHDGLHILFSGCSTTYGTGLQIEDTWAHKVYTKIAEKEKVSGYYNLGVAGTGLFFIVSNLFKYFEAYGNPDVVFINLPDMFRHYAVDDLGPAVEVMTNEILFSRVSKKVYNEISDNETKRQDIMSFWTNYYDYLMMLESYCKTNNIKLFVFSYSPSTNGFFYQAELDNFLLLDANKIAEEIIDFVSKNNVDKYFVTASDGAHEGHGFHTFWANKIMDFYLRGKNVN